MDMLDAFFLVFFSFYLGWKVREWHAMYYVHKMLNSTEGLEEELEQENPNRIHISVEHHEGMFFVYNAEDNSYMANATTMAEIQEQLLERFPNKTFAIAEENAAEMGIKL